MTMTQYQEKFLASLVCKVQEFKIGRKVCPNAFFISVDHVELIGSIGSEILHSKLPTIDCLIPVPNSPAFQGYDLPLAALLPVIATKSQREKGISLLRKDL